MSLVGSLEDLGLGDILQIVSLSRKSGLLLLRSEAGDGRIVLRDGLVRAAFVEGEPEDLRGLLVAGGFVSEADLELAAETARRRAISPDRAITECAGLSPERLDSLRREHVERAVLRMFTWHTGQFSFEVRDEIDERDVELLLPTGINTQYLTMEATRLGDERRIADEGGAEHDEDVGLAAADADEEPVFSGESPDAAGSRETLPPPFAPPAGGGLDGDGPPARLGEPSTSATRAQALRDAPRDLPCLVAIDSDLLALEWLKTVLDALFSRIHIFQRAEDGVRRIRQYLARAELPVILVSENAPADPLTGARDAGELIRRFKAQAPRMPVLAMLESGAEGLHGFDGVDAMVVRPGSHELGDPSEWSELGPEARAFREDLKPWAERALSASGGRAVGRPKRGSSVRGLPAADLGRLKELSESLRDPSTRGEVLSLVLEFAAETFSRVAMFMVRDEVAVGIAQIGLPRAGGPDDADLRRIAIGADGPAWFRAVIERRAALRAPPSDEGDRRLAALLGDGPPQEAYLAPVETGGRVVALLYADNLPDDRPIGDTTALEIVLHEAGLAFDRALLEHALAEAEDGSRRVIA